MKDQLVRLSGGLAIGGQALFATALAGATLLVGHHVFGLVPGAVIAGGVFAWFVLWFFAVPIYVRTVERGRGAQDQSP